MWYNYMFTWLGRSGTCFRKNIFKMKMQNGAFGSILIEKLKVNYVLKFQRDVFAQPIHTLKSPQTTPHPHLHPSPNPNLRLDV